jgi:hypothetical protein
MNGFLLPTNLLDFPLASWTFRGWRRGLGRLGFGGGGFLFGGLGGRLIDDLEVVDRDVVPPPIVMDIELDQGATAAINRLHLPDHPLEPGQLGPVVCHHHILVGVLPLELFYLFGEHVANAFCMNPAAACVYNIA